MEDLTQEREAEILLDATEEFNVALARVTAPQAKVLRRVAAGGSRREAVALAYRTKYPDEVFQSLRRSERFCLALRAALKLHALNFGLPAAWKREQLVYIITKHRDSYPAAAISALRLLAELDRDLDSPLINVTEDNRMLIVTPDSLKQMAAEAMKVIEHKE